MKSMSGSVKMLRVLGGVMACILYMAVPVDPACAAHASTPDLNGVWSPLGGGGNGGASTAGYPESQWSAERLPFTASGRAAFEANKPGKGPRQVPVPQRTDPLNQSNPAGLLRTLVYSRPSEFMLMPGKMVQVFELGRIWRAIHLDGRAVPKDIAAGPYWYGYSVGHWDADTLVVDTIALDERAWMDEWGTPFSAQARFQEQWRKVGPDRIELRVTVNDPVFYTRSWTSSPVIYGRQKPGVEPAEGIIAPIDEMNYATDVRDPAAATPQPRP